MTSVRMDKWLWAARFFKTRALAVRACEFGRIQSNGQPAKAAREVRIGDMLRVANDGGDFPVEVLCARNKIRTAPLWELRLRSRLMHDGQSVQLHNAIHRHKGESAHVTERFLAEALGSKGAAGLSAIAVNGDARHTRRRVADRSNSTTIPSSAAWSCTRTSHFARFRCGFPSAPAPPLPSCTRDPRGCPAPGPPAGRC